MYLNMLMVPMLAMVAYHLCRAKPRSIMSSLNSARSAAGLPTIW